MSSTQGRGTSVEDTLKDFWATRPRRPRRGRKVAGVAAGIGNRYGIDPVIVRVAFVVATFYGGAGILFYILGWLFLPEQDDEAAPFESMIHNKRSSTSSAFTVLLCLALIPAFWFFVDNEFSGLFGLPIVSGALYLLHRSRGHLGRPSEPAYPAATADPLAGEPTVSMPTSTAGTTGAAGPPVAEPTPPAWDPLGAAPFAWDLPEPAPPEPEPPAPRRKSKAGLFTVGLVLVAAGTLALAAPYTGWLSPAHVIGILLGILGFGMVGGAFLRGGRGLIWLAIPLSLVGIGLTVIAPGGWEGIGDINERPATIADVRDSYRLSVGSINLDLTGLPNTGSVETEVMVGGGDITVIVPENADVNVECVADPGDVSCLGHDESGIGAEVTVNDDGVDNGIDIDLRVEAGAGSVEVRRG
ncbi:MAG TPA: PspC domain-containing protein [Micromonosporaceae bacterium]|nr:PspC domain-containing protein [Micromonosporaceae bacterium]